MRIEKSNIVKLSCNSSRNFEPNRYNFISIIISFLTVKYLEASVLSTVTYRNRIIPVAEELSPLYIFVPVKKTFTVKRI